MANPDVVAYLRANLKKFPLEDLRKQLAEEGISDLDFNAALKAAQRPLLPLTTTSRKAGLVFFVVGIALVILIAIILLNSKPNPPPVSQQTDSQESAFIGHYGYVIRLPKNYKAVPAFKDPAKSIEVVHFCKKETDATNFVNEGLFGPMGIVRLEVRPDPWAENPQGFEYLSRQVIAATQFRKEKYHVKNLQISSFPGLQITIESPFPRLETYVLGKKVRYSFLSGQDDEIYQDIVMSLRDAQSEN